MALLLAFQAVSLIFACAATITGVQAIFDPHGFSRSFGLPLQATKSESRTNGVAASYVALMGVRQLATGLTLLALAGRGSWAEMAIILTILGFLVAGTDALELSRHGLPSHARFHAIPGALIAILSATFLVAGDRA